MATSEKTTQLSDLVIVPELIAESIILRTLATNAFVQSGVAVRDAALTAFLENPNGGKTISPRFIGPLKDDDPNISSDDPAEQSTPKKITGFKNTAVRQSLNQAWSSMDLTADLYGSDPIDAIRMQIGDYWQTVFNRRVLASVKGALSVEDVAKDMVVDITEKEGADSLFNADSFIDAVATMGDRAGALTAIAMHSHVYTTMKKLNLIDFIPDAEGRTNIATYQGLRVVQDDAMTASEEGKYYSYLFGPGAIALGMGSPKVPFEVERRPDSGNGGGEEIVYSRVEWIIHPQGFSYTKDTTPTIKDLETAENWKRTFERKRIALAALITK